MRRAWLLFVLSGCELIVGSSDANPLVIDRLTITPGTIDQTVDGDTVHYTATVPTTNSVRISAHSPDQEIQIKLSNGVDNIPSIGNGALSEPINVRPGANTVGITLHANNIGVETSYTLQINVAGAAFADPVSHPLPNQIVTSLDAADMNGDGTPDLIVGFVGHGFQVLDGKTFVPLGGEAPLGTFASLAVGDLDGDNVPDIVVADTTSTAKVFLNPGNGVFSGSPNSSIGSGIRFTTVTLGKIDGDAKLDVMLGDEQNLQQFDGTQQWMLGNGDGTFGQPKPNLAAGAQPAGMVIGALDSATGNDVMVLAGSMPGLTLLRGDNAGGLAMNGATSTFNGEAQPNTARSLIQGSFDANPVPDYALLHVDKSELRVITNFAGNETVPADSIQTSFPTCEGVSTMATADIDGDGHQDLIVPCNATNEVMLFYGDGAGDFTPVLLTIGVAAAPTAAVAADFNGDGKLDLAVASSGSNTLDVLLQEAP